MTAFIDEHRDEYGVEPICRVLPIAPSTYHERVAQRRDPSRLSPRAQRDEAMKLEVRRVFEANFKVYGVQGVAADAARGLRYCPLHGGAPDARPRLAGCDPGQAGKDHDERQDGAMPARSGQPPIPRPGAEHALGFRLHLWCASSRMIREAYVGMQKRKEELNECLALCCEGA